MWTPPLSSNSLLIHRTALYRKPRLLHIPHPSGKSCFWCGAGWRGCSMGTQPSGCSALSSACPHCLEPRFQVSFHPRTGAQAPERWGLHTCPTLGLPAAAATADLSGVWVRSVRHSFGIYRVRSGFRCWCALDPGPLYPSH